MDLEYLFTNLDFLIIISQCCYSHVNPSGVCHGQVLSYKPDIVAEISFGASLGGLLQSWRRFHLSSHRRLCVCRQIDTA